MSEHGKTIQLWPGGESVTLKGSGDSLKVKSKGGWRKPGSALAYQIRVEELAEAYLDRDVLCCDSALVDDMMKAGVKGFSIDEVRNMYPDPSDWDDATCRSFLDDRGVSYDDEDDNLDYLKELVRDCDPNEAYEWWRVTEWLAKGLDELGEIILENDYGYWWGRGCTGQQMIMDGTLQEVAKRALSR
jgi:hypothetical protein